MDEVSEILTQLEKTIRSDKVFADAHIYHWGETPSDLPVEDFTVPSIYMKVLKPMIPDSDFHLDIRYWWPLIERVSYRRWSINHHVI